LNGVLALWWGDPNLAMQYRADLLQAVDRGRAENARSPRAERDWRVSRALLQQARPVAPESSGAAPLSPGQCALSSAQSVLSPAQSALSPTQPALSPGQSVLSPGQPVLSLSHSGGHALVGIAPAGWRIGVDLEAIRARDTGRLAQWCCTDAEQQALAHCADEARRSKAFYLLWTLKESFIKAANLDFPADMRSVGLMPDAPPSPALDLPADAGWEKDGHPWAGWRLRAPQVGWHAWAAVVDDAWIATVVWRRPQDATGGDVMPGDATSDEVMGRGASGGDAGQDVVAGAVVPVWHTAQGAAVPRVIPAAQWS
jgi:4'-phosphopantetheinyl transferase